MEMWEWATYAQSFALCLHHMLVYSIQSLIVIFILEKKIFLILKSFHVQSKHDHHTQWTFPSGRVRFKSEFKMPCMVLYPWIWQSKKRRLTGCTDFTKSCIMNAIKSSKYSISFFLSHTWVHMDTIQGVYLFPANGTVHASPNPFFHLYLSTNHIDN
jgi:hypothetical protein